MNTKTIWTQKSFFFVFNTFFSLLREDHVRFTLVPFKHLSNQSCRKYNRPFSCLNNVYSYSFLYSESLERTPIENSQLSKINMDISLLLDQTKLLKRVFTKKFILFWFSLYCPLYIFVNTTFKVIVVNLTCQFIERKFIECISIVLFTFMNLNDVCMYKNVFVKVRVKKSWLLSTLALFWVHNIQQN